MPHITHTATGDTHATPRGHTMHELIKEAAVIAERVNLARFKGEVPDSTDTVRLCEIMSLLGG